MASTMLAMDDLVESVQRLREAEAEMARATAERDEAIRSAIVAEVPVTQIAEVSSLSRMRVYQIRDGRR